MRLFAIAALTIVTIPVHALAGSPVSWAAFCSLDAAKAKPCRISDTVSPDLIHHMTIMMDGTKIEFSGRNGGGWWFGRLNGQNAMGYERSRSHTVFSTTDFKTTFEWCDKAEADGICRN